MTAQMVDVVRYAGADFRLVVANGGALFEPKRFGLRPKMANTACFRGFVCTYEVRDDALLLDGLDATLIDEPARPLFGSPPLPRATPGFRTSYRSLAHPVPFTGGLLLGRDVLKEFYMQFHFAWAFRHVVAVELDKGRVTRAIDCSDAMARVREQVAGAERPSADATREVEALIARTFSRKY